MVFGEFMSGENFNDTGVRHLSDFFGLQDGGGSPGARCESPAGTTASMAVHPYIGRL